MPKKLNYSPGTKWVTPPHKPHKQIQVEYTEWLRYKRLADELSKEFGVKVSINALVKRAVNVYEESLVKAWVTN